MLIAFVVSHSGKKNRRSSVAGLDRISILLDSPAVRSKRAVVQPVSSFVAKRPREAEKWPRFAALVLPSEGRITLAPLGPGLMCQEQQTLLALELFQKAYVQHIAQQVNKMIQKFFSGVVRPETRKNPVDSRVDIGNYSNPVDAQCSWKHAITIVWRRDVFLEAVEKQDYGKVGASASNNVVTSHGGCGAQVAVEPKLITASSVENVVAPFLKLDARVYSIAGRAGSGKTEFALMHAALAYDRGNFVVVAARTKQILRELSLRFRQ
jgi:hypothetical protein